jgi:site-specific recombinase XerD
LKTIRTYRDAWKGFQKYAGCSCVNYLTAARLRTFVVTAGQCGVSAGAINTFVRSINSFLTWLHREGHSAEHLKIPKVKRAKRIIPTYSSEDIHRILSHKARNLTETRLLTLLALLVDTGIRIYECLSLQRETIDLDNLIIKVVGKGQKDRIIPLSIEARKILYRYLQSTSSMWCSTLHWYTIAKTHVGRRVHRRRLAALSLCRELHLSH